MSTPTSSSPSELDIGDEVSRKSLKEEQPKNSVGENSNQNDETQVEVIRERVEEAKADSTEQTMFNGGDASIRNPLQKELRKILVEDSGNQKNETKAKGIDEDDGLKVAEAIVDSTQQIALYARIIQVLDTGDETSRKSLKEELLKIIEEGSSKQNGETKAKVISENGGLRKTELVDCCVKWFKGKHQASRNSREEPPLKKNKSEEKNGNQNDEPNEGVRVNKPMSGGLKEFLEEHARPADGKEVHQIDYMSPKPWYPEKIAKPFGPYITW